MKCVNNEVLQAYIDGELEIEQRKDLEKHLQECHKCSEVYKVLKANDDFVFGKMDRYKQYCEEHFKPSAKPFEPEQTKNIKPTVMKGATFIMLQYRKAIAAACLVVAVTACITVQPVRAAISNALSIFRVENVKSIKITLNDIQEIQRKMASNEPEINVDKLGNIKTQGGQRKMISVEEAKNLQDFKVLFPSEKTNINPNISTTEPATINFTLNAGNVNEILKSFGAKKLFPKSVDGKTFTIHVSRQINLQYNELGRNYSIVQMKSPQIAVPEGVNVDELYSSVVELPILPENLQRQLKSIKDWKNTLYIPVVESQMQEVQINGSTGYIQTSENPERKTVHSSLIWFDNGVIYIVQGSLSRDEAINLAKSLK